MYFVLAAMVAGGVLGAFRAKARGGSRLDMAQYAGTFGIICGLLTLFVVVFLLRTV